MRSKSMKMVFVARIIMRLSNCSDPISPPGTPRDITFLRVALVFLSLYFLPCPALYKHSNLSFFECPALFYHTDFSLTLGLPGGIGSEQFDRRIIIDGFIDLFFYAVEHESRHSRLQRSASGVRMATEDDYNFIYILHPRAVHGFSWRQTSKYMPL